MKKVYKYGKKIEEKINSVLSIKELNDLKVEYTGKKGIITELSSGIKDAEDKKEYGMQLNILKSTFNSLYDKKMKELNDDIINKKLESETIDVTLPSTAIPIGAPNILERVIEEVEEVFMSMGYDVVDGPEIEEDKYNFELLNIPKGHPARDAQDTFYIEDEKILLRSQTSPVQARTMIASGGVSIIFLPTGLSG